MITTILIYSVLLVFVSGVIVGGALVYKFAWKEEEALPDNVVKLELYRISRNLGR